MFSFLTLIYCVPPTPPPQSLYTFLVSVAIPCCIFTFEDLELGTTNEHMDLFIFRIFFFEYSSLHAYF